MRGDEKRRALVGMRKRLGVLDWGIFLDERGNKVERDGRLRVAGQGNVRNQESRGEEWVFEVGRYRKLGIL